MTKPLPPTPPEENATKCPNPHCDKGMIRGTGVGCSICKGILRYTKHDAECDSLYLFNGRSGRCNCGLCDAVSGFVEAAKGIAEDSNTDRGQGQSFDAPLTAQIVTSVPLFSAIPPTPESVSLTEEMRAEILDVLIWATGIAPRETNPMVEKACQLVAQLLQSESPDVR